MVNTSLVELIKVASEYGFLLTFGVASVYLLFTYFKKKINKDEAATPVPTEEVSLTDLRGHRLFKHCTFYVNFGVRKIRFSANYPIRAKMYRAMLEIYFESIGGVFNSSLDTLVNADENLWDQEALRTLRKVVDCYEQRFHQDGVPQIVIDKFNEWHDPTLSFITSQINTVGESKIAEDSAERTDVLLGTVLSASKAAFFGIERTLIELNGELTGKVYRGETIE